MASYKNMTASGVVKALSGKLKGFFVSTASGSPTIALTSGASGTPAAAVKATGVLTTTDVFADGETVTVGLVHKRTYTFRAALTSPAVKDEVLIGASAAASLDNLKSAINGSAGAGTTYSTGTAAHLEVTATTNTDTEQTVEAIQAGLIGNSYVSTETCANASFAAATLAGGLAAVVTVIPAFTPAAATYYPLPADGVDFDSGLYYTEGGTVDVTFFFD